MLELLFKGSRRYWIWMGSLAAVMVLGFVCYLDQFNNGLMVTGQGRDVSWGFYTAQMTFFVGVAAGGVMLVLPYYLHDYKAFGRITILGEFLAVAALSMCLTYLLVHLGQPTRALNIFFHPTPWSMLFWDGNVLSAYLILNIIIGWKVMDAEYNAAIPPKWLKPLVYLSIPMAFSIHTMTAFIYCGLPGRGFWLTAVLAPRFLASAFAAGPALLILLAMVIRQITSFDAGNKAIQSLAIIATYGLIANLFFMICEVFVVFYSAIPAHTAHFEYLYLGLHGKNAMVPWMWASIFLMSIAVCLLIMPIFRKNNLTLAFACICLFCGTWIDKSLGIIAGGFIPSPLHHVTEYFPSSHEIIISAGITAMGLFILTALYKMTIAVKTWNN